MSQEDSQKEENDDVLRRFIDRLEAWPEDAPPTPAELRALRREIRLTQDDRDKLEILSENHIRRARAAQDAGAYAQAAAELARAAQLRPLDPRPRTELAEIYLQRSLERGYGRNDRAKAVRLARKALELSPGDPEAQAFLREYRRMNADFRTARNRRYYMPVIILVILLTSLAVWQREWVVDFFTPGGQTVSAASGAVTPQPLSEGETRQVEVNTPGLESDSLEAEILRASLGRRNDSSYVDVRGRLRSLSSTVGSMELILRGRDESGNAVFAMPVSVRSDTDPLLRPGDSQSLTVFRWLADDSSAVDYLDIEILAMDLLEDPPPYVPETPELVWQAGRPEGVELKAEVRNLQRYEAFDRQVLIMDLALSNTGVRDVGEVSMNISFGSEWQPLALRGISPEDAPLERGERRVWPVAMGLPLDADIERQPITVTITEAGG